MEGFTGFIERIPYGIKSFNGQIFPLYFPPPDRVSISNFIRNGGILADSKTSSEPYILFNSKK